MFNFSNFKPVHQTYTKEGSNLPTRAALVYDMRYVRSLTKKEVDGKQVTGERFFFEIGKAKFDELNLNGPAYGVIQTVSPEGVSYIAVVDNENATLLKTTKKNEGKEKGRQFKSDIVEAALAEQGVIDTKIVGEAQYLGLNLLPGSEGAMLGEGDGAIKTYGVYEIVKANKPEGATSSAEEAEPETEGETEEETSSAPAQAPVAAAPAASASDDDF